MLITTVTSRVERRQKRPAIHLGIGQLALVKNIFIVQKEDSLQRMANDEGYRNKIIENLIQLEIEEERRKKEALENEENFSLSNGPSNFR